jgi:hypothetical protein
LYMAKTPVLAPSQNEDTRFLTTTQPNYDRGLDVCC